MPLLKPLSGLKKEPWLCQERHIQWESLHVFALFVPLRHDGYDLFDCPFIGTRRAATIVSEDDSYTIRD
jgi:hypothetical protein